MTTVLLTGFEPFAGDATNPSGDAVRVVQERWAGAEDLVVEVLPVAFDAAATRLRQLLDEHRPDVVIATGLAGGRAHVTPERVAINLADARIPDNDGAQPVDRPVVDGGPVAYFATLPVKAIAAALDDEGIPAAVSHSAGTFVCNHVMYTVLDAAAPDVRAGFVHLPYARDSAP
ncbi:MAG: pyrrolidone-carboxylate peptidase, partial [Microbacterium sp.]|nr:pyrrolidone-carboxylate peptidase [Microbacterium sp.]